MKIFQIVVLSLSGLALLYACSSRLINPTNAVFLETYLEENELETDIVLVNEIRGVGAVMLLGAMVAFAGAIRVDFRQTAFIVITVIFGGIVLGRSFSLFIDGIPSPNLMRVAMIEIVLGVLNVVCLIGILIQGRRGQTDSPS